MIHDLIKTSSDYTIKYARSERHLIYHSINSKTYEQNLNI